MGTYRHKLSFCVDHESLDLSVIPEQLDMPASRLWNAGNPRTTPDGTLLGGNHRDSFCSINFEASSEISLPDSLKAALVQLIPHREFLEHLTGSGAKLRFFIGWVSDFNSRDCLDWNLLAQIAGLKISLDFDFYGPDEADPIGQSQ